MDDFGNLLFNGPFSLDANVAFHIDGLRWDSYNVDQFFPGA